MAWLTTESSLSPNNCMYHMLKLNPLPQDSRGTEYNDIHVHKYNYTLDEKRERERERECVCVCVCVCDVLILMNKQGKAAPSMQCLSERISGSELSSSPLYCE